MSGSSQKPCCDAELQKGLKEEAQLDVKNTDSMSHSELSPMPKCFHRESRNAVTSLKMQALEPMRWQGHVRLHPNSEVNTLMLPLLQRRTVQSKI